MKVKLYEMLNHILNYYRYTSFTGKITKDEIENFNDEKIEISDQDVKLVEDILNSNDRRQAIKDHIVQEYSQMEPEKVTENVLEFIREGVFDQEIISAVQDVNNLLDNLERLETIDQKIRLITMVKEEDISKYLNEGGKQKENIIKASENFYWNEFVMNIVTPST